MLFFDLEFYVPMEYREYLSTHPKKKMGSLYFNPTIDSHLILGGVFIHVPSFKIEGKKFSRIIESSSPHAFKKENITVHSVWLWEYAFKERDVLKKIYDIFLDEWNYQKTSKDTVSTIRIVEALTCGIGIGRIDLPSLYVRSEKFKIASSEDLFNVFLKTRFIDLSLIGIWKFPRRPPYPKTANQLSSKVLKNKKRKPSGTMVWSLFENKDYEAIEQRCYSEVLESIKIYEKLYEDLYNPEYS